MFRRRYSISVLDRNWNPIISVLKTRHVPRASEMLFIEETNKYYRVINVVTSISKLNRTGAFVIVEELETNPKEETA